MNIKNGWSYQPYDPVETDVHGNPGKPYQFLITDLQPRNGEVLVGWQPMAGAETYRITLVPYGENAYNTLGGIPAVLLETKQNRAVLAGVQNDTDYEVQIDAFAGGKRIGKALSRWVRCHGVPGSVVSYVHQDDHSFSYSGRSTATPGILRLPSGELLCSHDMYWPDAPQNLTKIFSSMDDGKTWSFVCDVIPCFWGKLFYHQGAVYLLGCETECGALLLGKSTDDGRTFSKPITIYPGGTRRTGGPMRSSLPVISYKGRLWTSMDVGSYPLGYHDTVIVSADETMDLMNPKAWTCSKPLHYNPEWPGASKGAPLTGFLEGNMIVGPQGQLYDLMRYETRGGDPSFGLAGLVEMDPEHPESMPRFVQFVNFPGNLSRFTVMKDGEDYYALVSRVLDEPTYYRGRLSLITSKDLINWTVVRDVLDIKGLDDEEWPNKTAFQYPDAFIENGTIYAALRTALYGAYNYHNANYITFHKFPLKEGEA